MGRVVGTVAADGAGRPADAGGVDEGTERSDKAAPNKGVEKFWGEMPTWGMYLPENA